MSAPTVAFVAENFVFVVAIAAGWHLLRQGGGLQVKTPPPAKRPAQDSEAAKAPAGKPLRRAS